MGKQVSNENYTDILLASLPTLYDSTCSSISHSACLRAQPLTTNTFESMILDKFTQCKIKKNKSNSKDEAFAADASKPKKQYSNCNKHGHVKANCWAKGRGKEGQGPQGPKKNNDNKSKDKVAVAEENDMEVLAAIEEVEDNIVAAVGSTLAQPERACSTATKLYNSGAS